MAVKKTVVIKTKKVVSSATLPTYVKGSASIALYSSIRRKLAGNTIGVIPTGVSLDIPEGNYLYITNSRTFGSNNTLSVKTEIIENGKTGEVDILMANTGPYPIDVPAGTEIARGILTPIPSIKIEEV
ncbi:hypothetical protein H8D85_01135 [bacterium]|nr:hypothetical protein [bacterium]